MEDYITCYLWENGQRVEITYGELRTRRASDPAFRRRRFWMFDGTLLEVTEAEFRQLNKDANHRFYLHTQEQNADVRTISEEAVTEQDLLWGAPHEGFEERTLQRIVCESVKEVLAVLPDDEKALVQALFYEGVTERALAKQWGLTHGAIHQRKLKLLDKLRLLLKVE